jgi:rhodanese-related sulfurtransferase
MRFLTMFIVALCLILPSIALSAGQYATITSNELKKLLDRKNPGVVVIDSRSPQEYQEAHIGKAVNIPWARMEKEPSLLAYPKSTKLVFYCSGGS